MNIDNAVILAAGLSSRFRPISDCCPKALLPVNGEILIERQIRQLAEAGIKQICIVTGYLAECFSYLERKYPQVTLVHNPDYRIRNNHSSIYAARRFLGNSYICCGDNYFPENPFSAEADRPFYSGLYAKGATDEWCLTLAPDGRITGVSIGGADACYMLGHVCWDAAFSKRFLEILEAEYDLPETKDLMWEHLYRKHIDELTLYFRPYRDGEILEFDSLEDIRTADPFYRGKTAEELAEYFSRLQKER